MGRKIARLNRDKRTVKKKQADFLAAFAKVGNITGAAKEAKVDRRVHYEWLEDPAYAEQFDALGPLVLNILEDEAHRRAVDGVDKPVWQGGKKMGTVKEYSDTLMIVLLKARAPEKYKDRVQNEVVGKGGKDLYQNATDAELEARLAELEQKAGTAKKPKKGRK